MTERLELYKCKICGNLVQVILNGIGELVCCGENMEKLIPNKEDNDELSEKHIPQIERNGEEVIIKLEHHPMVEEHFIQFIEVQDSENCVIHLKYLKPNEKAEFKIQNTAVNIDAIEYCNIHGLWRNKND